MPDQAVARFAAKHHGVFALRHAYLRGITPKAAEHRIRTGQWIRIHECVFSVPGAPRTWKRDLLAACWAGGFRAVASHRSAAALWGLAGGRKDVQEITCPRWRRARHDGLAVHESTALDPIDVTLVDGIPVTTPERTLLDLAAVCGFRTVEMAFNRAEHEGLVTGDSVRGMLRRLARSGRRGVRKLRRVLDARAPGQRPTESEMETRLLQILREDGLPEGISQYEIWHEGRFVARVDRAYPEQRVALEYDSDQWHGSGLDHERDASRRRRLRAIDWEVVTTTRLDLRNGGPETCAALRSALGLVSFCVANPS
jgi:predicted transcriptional regulator of viral defense system